MPEFGPSPEFIDKYNLHKTPEVESSVSQLREEGERIPEARAAHIDAHFRRIERALESKRGLFNHLVKDKLVQEYTINLTNPDGSENQERVNTLAQGLFESEKEIARRRGMGEDLEALGDTLSQENFDRYRQQIYGKKAEQEKTLGNWIDYLGSEEASFYPVWFKYVALRSLQKMGKRDRDTETYSKRSANTLQPFPDLSREALALTLDAIKQKEAAETPNTESTELLTEDEQQAQAEVAKLVERGDFPRLYAHFQGEIERAKREKGESTAGEWVHYPQGSDAQALVSTLAGKGTEWCTAGYDVASSQLQSGEFYVYYTYDQAQKPNDPRIAIYLIDGEISEVRGVYGKDQDLELDFVDIAREKYQEFAGSEKYEKKDHDMKALTQIERKTKANQELTKDELVFLYEINDKIEGFGHGADPRVAEIRAARNPREDAPIVLDCQSQEIAWNQNEVNETTKSYIGPLFPGIFTQLANIEQIYTAFPEGKIDRGNLIAQGKDGQELKTELEERKINIGDDAKFMLQSREFTIATAGEQLTTIRLKVRDLFNDNNAHSYQQITHRAEGLGLDFLPHETAADLLLEGKSLPRLYEWRRVVTKPITDRYGNPDVFDLGRDDSGLWLRSRWAYPAYQWSPGRELLFGLRQVSQEA